jgi:multisubunit Na+/H+ antiporter MnhE subunit
VGALIAGLELGAAWLVLAGSLTAAEAVAAVLAAACALVAMRVTDTGQRLASLHDVRPAAFLRAAAGALLQCLLDASVVCGAVLRAAAGERRAAGSIGEQPVSASSAGRTPLASRAVAATLGSYPPNTAVVAIDSHRRTLVVHTLVRSER